MYTPDKIPIVVETVQNFLPSVPDNCAMAVGIGCIPGTNVPTIMLAIFYNGAEAEGREVFRSFFDIEAAMTMMETRPYVQQVSSVSKISQLIISECLVLTVQRKWYPTVSKGKRCSPSHPAHHQRFCRRYRRVYQSCWDRRRRSYHDQYRILSSQKGAQYPS